MQLKYGSYAFDANACEVTSSTGIIRSDTGRPIRQRVQIHVRAYLAGSGQQANSRLETALRVALAVPYQDLVLKQDDGTNSSLGIITNNSITGVVITDGPHFGEAQGAEFVNRRTCEFMGECEIALRGTERAVISFHETVSIIGDGGPQVIWRHPVNAGPIQQIVSPSTTVRAVQSGQAVGHRVRPAAPPALFPRIFMHRPRSRVTPESPRRIGPGPGGLVDWGVSWNYEFEANVPLIALPNVPSL